MVIFSAMAEVFQCFRCRLSLTKSLVRLPVEFEPEWADGRPLLPAGRYWVSDGEEGPAPEGWIYIHLGDAINTKHHHLKSRLNGCCGLDGCDGPNTLCLHGHEIGTERSDCWMSHSLALDPGAVIRSRA